MAETFSFEDALQSEPVKNTVGFSFEEAAMPARKPESVGLLEGAGAAAKRGLESFADVGAGLGLAGTAITGTEEETRKKMQAIKAEQKKPQETPGMTWADFERIASEKGISEALKEAPKYIVEQVIQNAPQMAAPLAVGAGVGAVSGPLAPITGPLAGIATYGVQQFGNFLVRQAQEKDDPKELELAKAALTAAGTAPLGYFVDRFTAGLGSAGKEVGKQAVKELAARSATGIAAGATKAVGKGAAKGVIAEAPTEVLEQVAERYQAGLDLTGDDAIKEYKEAFAGAAAAGGATKAAATGVEVGRGIAQEKFSFEEAKQPEPVMTKGERKNFEQAQDRAQKEVIPVPASEAQDTQAMMDELLGEKPTETMAEPAPLDKPVLKPAVEVKRDAGTIANTEIVETPVAELKLSADVPQFKAAANEQGIVEPLKGKKYERTGTAPIQVWRRLNGDLEVISGRHRFDLARRTGEQTIPAQVFDEAQGFNADMAAIMDAELNIRDEKGTVSDYVNYFKETGRQGLTEQDYESRGLLDGTTGRRAYAVAAQGSDDLISALNAGQVSEDAAHKIVRAAPNDSRLQALGLKLAQDKSLPQVVNIIQAAKTIPVSEEAMTGDMFGFDDSAMKTAEDMAKIASRRQREISSDIKAIEGAGRNPAIAKKYGIDVKDPDSIKERVAEMKQQRSNWDSWASNPELVDEIRREMSGEPVAAKAKPEAAPIEKVAELKLEPTVDKAPAEKKAEAAEAEVRELKAIADREREVFDLTPKSPDTGIDPAVQQDMLGASGMTEQEFKKGIDKNSTEPGEPLVLRDVTMNEKQTYNDIANKKVDEEQIGWFNNIEAAKNVEQKFDNKTVDVGDKGLYDTVEEQAKAIEDAVAGSKDHKFTAKEFRDIAQSELDKGNISPEVFAAIEDAYKKHPGILEGISLQVDERGQPNVLGQFQPIARLVKLFKDTSGVMDPSTVRHEIAHAMEQMMTSKQKLAIVGEWRKALANAMRADKTKEGAKFFAAVSEFLHAPSLETLRAAQNAMPNDSYYQYINPSEYWAVNAEELLKAQLGGGWGKFKININGLYDSLKNSFGMSNFWVGNNVFKQILEGDRMSSKMLLHYIFKTKRRNYKGDPAPVASWVSRPTDWLEDKKYKYVDKYVDLLRATTDIQEKSGEISDMLNAYQKETLSHGRMSKAMKDFLNKEGRPLAEVMQKYNITQPQMHDYLVARHAEERNKQIAKINPEMQDGGSGMTYAEVNDYMSKISPERRKQFDEAAKIVDQMVRGTQDVLVDNGLETQETIDAWNKSYEFYVPLYRKDLDYTRAGRGSGRGYTSRGSFSKRATGSMKDVEDVLESIAVERIRAIERAEKSRVGRALYGMAIGNPNPDFWLPINRDAIKSKEKTKAELRKLGLDDDVIDNIMEQPKSPKIDQETGLVYYAPDSYTLNSPNVFSVRIDGKDRFIIFNSSDPRASRLAGAMQNMDMPEIEGMLRSFAYVTRWLSSVNTQYNPIFGAYNFIRDVQGAALNLSSTELRGSEWEVTKPKRLWSIIKGIYSDLRSERKTGKAAKGKWSDLWEDFQKHGGQTGYKSQFVQPKDDAKLVAEAIGNLNKGNIKKTVDGIIGWLSDYNDSMENAVRLSAYEVALSKGMSKDKAANLAKNLTVNFNRKGANSSLAGSLFAFFNASVQGTARLYETLSGPNGKKIIYGGLALGAIQAVAIAAAGFEDDEPPEFVKEKSIIIPVGGKKYLSIPMPLGFNVIPGLGRIFMEGAMNPDKASDKFFSLLSLIANSFNPLGSSGLTLQTLAPTALDPFVSLATNKDSFGKPIYRKDRETNPQVGYERTRDNTSAFWKEIAMYVNYLTGGTEFTKGMWSPTGDEISYLVQQAGGGLAREVGKIYGGATDLAEGNEIAPYKIPIVGKLYGDAESKANVGSRFYRNVTQLAEVEREIAGRKKAGKDASEIYAKHPEASLISQANRIENEVSQINRRKRVMVEKGATMEQLKQLEDLKERKMRQLNERYAKVK